MSLKLRLIPILFSSLMSFNFVHTLIPNFLLASPTNVRLLYVTAYLLALCASSALLQRQFEPNDRLFNHLV